MTAQPVGHGEGQGGQDRHRKGELAREVVHLADQRRRQPPYLGDKIADAAKLRGRPGRHRDAMS